MPSRNKYTWFDYFGLSVIGICTLFAAIKVVSIVACWFTPDIPKYHFCHKKPFAQFDSHLKADELTLQERTVR